MPHTHTKFHHYGCVFAIIILFRKYFFILLSRCDFRQPDGFVILKIQHRGVDTFICYLLCSTDAMPQKFMCLPFFSGTLPLLVLWFKSGVVHLLIVKHHTHKDDAKMQNSGTNFPWSIKSTKLKNESDLFTYTPTRQGKLNWPRKNWKFFLIFIRNFPSAMFEYHGESSSKVSVIKFLHGLNNS